MKHIFFSMACLLFSTFGFSQQNNLLNKNSSLVKKYQLKNLDFFDSEIFKKEEKHLSNFGLKKASKYNSSKGKMPNFEPKGNYKTRLIKVDTINNYSLRIIVPE